MKNYSLLASKYGVVGSHMDTFDYVSSYKINRENNYVEITCMSGWQKKEELKEDTIQKLDEQQRGQLDTMREKIDPKIDSRIRWQSTLLFLYGTNTLLQYSLQHWFAGSCWLLGSGIYFGQCYFPYKLKKEMELVAWVMDNKEYVDQVIQREVSAKMPKTEETNTMNRIKVDYPTDLVPYSESMYEDGINLSNIDELKVKQLKKLKKKAIKVIGKRYV